MWNWAKKWWGKLLTTPVEVKKPTLRATDTPAVATVAILTDKPQPFTTTRTASRQPVAKVPTTATVYKGIVLQNSGFRKDRQARLFCILTVRTATGQERVFCWKYSLPATKWSLAIKLKAGDQISYQGRSWDGGLQATNLIEAREKIVWSTVERELASLRLAFLDIETVTNWAAGNEIAEIAYQIYQDGQLVLESSFLVRPRDMRLSRTVNIYNNISIAALKKARNWETILPIIQEELAGAVIVSHNFKGFDYHCLQKAHFFQRGLTYYFFDTLAPAKLLVKERAWEGKSDLQNLIRKIRQNENFMEKHRALPDALLHKELFDYLMQNQKKITLLYRVH